MLNTFSANSGNCKTTLLLWTASNGAAPWHMAGILSRMPLTHKTCFSLTDTTFPLICHLTGFTSRRRYSGMQISHSHPFWACNAVAFQCTFSKVFNRYPSILGSCKFWNKICISASCKIPVQIPARAHPHPCLQISRISICAVLSHTGWNHPWVRGDFSTFKP